MAAYALEFFESKRRNVTVDTTNKRVKYRAPAGADTANGRNAFRIYSQLPHGAITGKKGKMGMTYTFLDQVVPNADGALGKDVSDEHFFDFLV